MTARNLTTGLCRVIRALALFLICAPSLCVVAGCETLSRWTAPGERLSFPAAPFKVDSHGRYYDVAGRGVSDFAILNDESGRLDILAYDDDRDGRFDRFYRLSDYSAAEAPHLIILIDSLPYRLVSKRYERGDWRWFYPPRKVIPPFPSLSNLVFNDILQGPPMPAFKERYYDARYQETRNLLVKQAFGYRHPWSGRTDFVAEEYWHVGMMYFNPRPWYAYELARIKRALDESLNRVCIVYVVASSGMVSKYAEQGAQEAMDRIEQLCMQLLYERRGAVKITLVSDHGHNLRQSTNVLFDNTLREGGFHPANRIENPATDVVVEIDGLVTSFGIHTARPRVVADLLLQKRPEIQLALYQEGHRVVIRDSIGTAAIDRRGQSFRYTPIDRDVLNYRPVLEKLASAGKLDADRFAADREWLAATADHEFPDAPFRAWDAFHGLVVNPADVLFTLKDGYCAGVGVFTHFITMASTHGGLNQINSDAMLMTMVAPIAGPLRSRDVMSLIEPRYVPALPPRMFSK